MGLVRGLQWSRCAHETRFHRARLVLEEGSTPGYEDADRPGEVHGQPGVNVTKLFTAVIYQFTNKLECLHPLQSFPGCVGKAGAYPSETPFR
jgi:hypothetical protein